MFHFRPSVVVLNILYSVSSNNYKIKVTSNFFIGGLVPLRPVCSDDLSESSDKSPSIKDVVFIDQA